jgi:hypothetical protein
MPSRLVIDDAELHRPAEQDDAPDAVVAPYRWLLERVGTGVRLTQAGYLPPALVAEAMAALGWQDDWPGKHNREDLTIPILELRESAQRFGLLRKDRGQLLVTKVGRSLVDDPVGLWWHLGARCRTRDRSRNGTPARCTCSPSPPAVPETTRCSRRACGSWAGRRAGLAGR